MKAAICHFMKEAARSQGKNRIGGGLNEAEGRKNEEEGEGICAGKHEQLRRAQQPNASLCRVVQATQALERKARV